MSTQTMLLGGLAIALLLASSSKADPTLIGGARPAGKVGGARTYGPGAPLPAQAPSGSPGGQTPGATLLGALYTNVLGNADKIGAGIGDIITAIRATDTGDDGTDVPDVSTPVPLLAQGSGSGASWVGFNLVSLDTVSDDAGGVGPGGFWGQDSSFDMAVPDFSGVPEAA